MISKWLDEVEERIFNDTSFSIGFDAMETLERIDKLLRRAMVAVDDEVLHDEIRKEINGH